MVVLRTVLVVISKKPLTILLWYGFQLTNMKSLLILMSLTAKAWGK